MNRSRPSHRQRLKMHIATAVIVLIGIALIGGSSVSAGRPPAPQRTPQGKGRFKVAYIPVKNKDYKELQQLVTSEHLLEEIADDLNKTIALPVDVTLSFGECGEANAFYDPEKQRIIFCYEFLVDLAETYAPHAKTDDELGTKLSGAIMHIFFHELGHALTHVLDLPVTGKEEDAVDQLATVILVESGEDGEKAVLDASIQYLSMYKAQGKNPFTRTQFADEHSLDPQRFYNLLCWVYGHDETKYAYLVNKGYLPKERGVRCADEYEKISKSWGRLLEPYLKD
jgi:hypothetical protein